MSLTELAVKRPTALFAIFALCIGLGVMGYMNLGADLFPTVNTPFVVVSSIYGGAGSKEIENDLMKPLEDSVSSLAGIRKIRTTSAEGFGYILLEFSMSTNPDTAVMDVQKAVDAAVSKLPGDATKPVVYKYNLNARPILILSLTGSVPYEDLYATAENLKRQIENVSGVGQVKLEGAPKKRLEIVLDRMAVENWGLSLQTVIGILKANNMNAPAGVIKQDGVDRTVRIEGQLGSIEEIRGLLIPLPRGGAVPLGELALVRFTFPDDEGRIRMNGKSAIGLTVIKSSDSNVVATTKRIKKAIAVTAATLPGNIEFKVASDQTVFINSSLEETMRDLFLGILSTAIVLFLFLREWRNSLIVLVAIPTSLISTFFMMYLLGFTMNIVSTMALALCIGILVDDSIVVLENIHRHQAMGKDPVKAAIDGRREIGMAAIAITLSDVVVFAPVAFLSDLVGQFLRQFGFTIVFAALFSLFVSFTLTPALASRLSGTKRHPVAGEAEGKVRKVTFFDRRIKTGYRSILLAALRHRLLVLGGISLMFIASISLIPLGVISTEFLPSFDQGKLAVRLTLDSGSDIERTDAMVKVVEEHLLSLPETQDVFSGIGVGDVSNIADISVNLKEKGERKKRQSVVAKELRDWGQNLPGVVFSVTEPSIVEQTSTDGSKPLIINVAGPDRAVVSDLSSRIERIVRETQGTVDVENSMRSRRTELTFRIDRVALSQYGLTVGDAAMTLRTALAGTEVGVFRRSGEEYDMLLRFSPEQTRTLSDLAAIQIASPYGSLVTMGQIAEIGRGAASNTLNRLNRSNVATIQANLEGRALGAITADIQKIVAEEPLPNGYRIDLQGDSSMMNDSFGSLAWALAASVLLLYLVLLVLYESYLTPLIRMLSLPAGIIGGLAALALTGKAINLMVFIGIIMLDGLASKNGTLLIDYANTLVKRGMSLRDALLESGMTRLRPIMMTSMTMVVGMLPLAISSGSSSEIKSSMAILLIGGIIASTILSPILIPVVYTLIDDARNSVRRRKPRRATATPKGIEVGIAAEATAGETGAETRGEPDSRNVEHQA